MSWSLTVRRRVGGAARLHLYTHSQTHTHQHAQRKGDQGHLVHLRLKSSRDVIIESPLHMGTAGYFNTGHFIELINNVLVLCCDVGFAYLILITV